MLIPHYLGVIRAGEEQLAEAYKVVSDRHSQEYEIRQNCKMFAQWSAGHIEGLQPYIDQYGIEESIQPEQLRASLFHGLRAGQFGALKDMQDLGLLASSVRTNWTVLKQMAGAQKDKNLEDACEEYGAHLDREEHWICTAIKNIAPETGIVPADLSKQAAGSIPTRPTSASFPDMIWAPLVAGVMTLLVGLASLLIGKMWLFPSLGPTMYLQGESPAHPSTRFYNVVVGHIIGLISGFIGVLIFNAMNDPVALQTSKLTPGRLGASVVALVLTIFITLLAKANHPPAGATTLLVSLGAINDLNKVISLIAGVLLVAILGEATRYIRLGRAGRAVLAPKIPGSPGQ